MSKPKTFNPPKKIYLQVVGTDDSADIEETYSKPFDETEVTWCTDKINDSDLEYVLAGSARRSSR